MAEQVEMDQKVYDELIAAGKSERIARAKAKAAAVRASKQAAGEEVGSRDAARQDASSAATAGGGEPARAGGGVVTTDRTVGEGGAAGTAGGRGSTGEGGAAGTDGGRSTGLLTPEERQARVAAALAARGDGPRRPGARSVGQEHTHRLLAMVPPTGIQQIRGKQEDKVYVWPHLLSAEFLALLAVTALLTVFSAVAPAPLRELANPNMTPNPSKAPWYFLGLQELLRYFHPMIAGVTIPGVGLGLLAALPYLDKNPSVKPENRKTAYVAFTFFLIFWAVLVIVGSFFRGPGFNWVWPWIDGLFFEL